jgi:hypothetical protein
MIFTKKNISQIVEKEKRKRKEKIKHKHKLVSTKGLAKRRGVAYLYGPKIPQSPNGQMMWLIPIGRKRLYHRVV